VRILSQKNSFSCLLLTGLISLVASVLANSDAPSLLKFDTQEQGYRYYQLLDEIRCPKCQNQNLADSDAQIAHDLRNELYSLIRQNLSDDEIFHFMSSRYGNFVLYDPPMNNVTAILWILPLGLFLLSIIIIILKHRFSASVKGQNDAQ